MPVPLDELPEVREAGLPGGVQGVPGPARPGRQTRRPLDGKLARPEAGALGVDPAAEPVVALAMFERNVGVPFPGDEASKLLQTVLPGIPVTGPAPAGESCKPRRPRRLEATAPDTSTRDGILRLFAILGKNGCKTSISPATGKENSQRSRRLEPQT